MGNKNYVLTVKIPISGIDDFEARVKAKELVSSINSLVLVGEPEPKVKLQEIFGNKEPRGIKL